MTESSDPQPTETEPGRAAGRATPPARRAPLSKLVAQVVSTVCAGGLITWSVFNLAHNGMLYWSNQEEGQNWIMAGLMVILTCVAPLLLGFYWLARSLDPADAKRRGS